MKLNNLLTKKALELPTEKDILKMDEAPSDYGLSAVTGGVLGNQAGKLGGRAIADAYNRSAKSKQDLLLAFKGAAKEEAMPVLEKLLDRKKVGRAGGIAGLAVGATAGAALPYVEEFMRKRRAHNLVNSPAYKGETNPNKLSKLVANKMNPASLYAYRALTGGTKGLVAGNILGGLAGGQFGSIDGTGKGLVFGTASGLGGVYERKQKLEKKVKSKVEKKEKDKNTTEDKNKKESYEKKGSFASLRRAAILSVMARYLD